jgi:hypothetical protein
MTERKVALVAETKRITAKQLKRAEAVLKRRLEHDLAPVWSVSGILQSYSEVSAVPKDCWPVIVKDDIGMPGAYSVHMDNNGEPFALVTYSPNWEFMASHDMLEMLIDPFGKRFAQGPSVRPGQKHRVAYLVEVCDPCASEEYGYEIDGVRVADFCTPDYYQAKAKPGSRLSFTGAIGKPFEVMKGGYLSWQEPDGSWWQKQWFGGKPRYINLGVFETNSSDEFPASSEISLKRKTMSSPSLVFRNVEETRGSAFGEARAVIEELIRRYGAS